MRRGPDRDGAGAGMRRVPTRPGQAAPRVALVIETSLASGRDILRGIARYAREHGPWSIYHEPRSLEDSVPGWLRDWDGDGIIARVQNAQIAEAVATSGVPTVDVLGVARRPELPLAHVDNAAIARLAARHFLERGFRHFGFCGLDGVNWSDERREAFARAVAGGGRTCSVFSFRDRADWEDEQDRLADWVRALPRPCAVMACNDPRGQMVLEACRRVVARVPDEVAVIGVDNDEPICAIADPPLSSVVPDHERVGYEAASLLDRVRAGEAGPGEEVFIPPLGIVARPSSDVIALDDREVAEAIGFIRRRACDGLGVDEICRELALSRSTLQRRFRAALGRTIHDEIVRVRLAHARELLAETDMPIAKIAERCGFGHQEYLGAVFRARFGQTPASFRRSAGRAGAGRRAALSRSNSR
jgi:LacI family transcriptional regulator